MCRRFGQVRSDTTCCRSHGVVKKNTKEILQNPQLKPHEPVIEKENIVVPRLPEGKRPARSIIENVQHQHTHKVDGYKVTDIVRVNEATKPFLNEINNVKRKRFCEWAVD